MASIQTSSLWASRTMTRTDRSQCSEQRTDPTVDDLVVKSVLPSAHLAFIAVRWVAIGTNATKEPRRITSAYRGKADSIPTLRPVADIANFCDRVGNIDGGRDP